MQIKAKAIILQGLFCLLFVFILQAETIAFKEKKVKAGDTFLESSSLTMNIKMSIKMPDKPVVNMTLNKSNIIKKDEKVLEVKDDKAVKYEIQYLQHEESEIDGENTNTTAKPVSGKTYLIEMTDKGPVIKDVEGNIPPDEELEIIKSDVKKNTDLDSVRTKFSGKKMEIGQNSSDLDGFIGEIFDLDEKSNIKNISSVLKESRIYNKVKCAVFELKLEANTDPSEPTQISMKIQGELLINLDTSLPVYMSLKGPLNLTQTQGAGNINAVIMGGGDVEFNVSRE